LTKAQTDTVIYEGDLVYRGIFVELLRYGKIVDMVLCNSLQPNLRGSVYLMYDTAKGAERCIREKYDKLYNGIIIKPQFVDVEALADILCHPYNQGKCQCSFLVT